MAHNLYSRIVFLKSTRKHRIGSTQAKFVINSYEPVENIYINENKSEVKWIGIDAKERELEIIGVIENSVLIVKHVMPTVFRRNK